MGGLKNGKEVTKAPELLKVITLKGSDEIRFFEHKDGIEIRIFKNDGKHAQPTKKGLFVRYGQFPEFVSVLETAKVRFLEREKCNT